VLGVLLLGAVVAGVLGTRLLLVQKHTRPVPVRLAAASGTPSSPAPVSSTGPGAATAAHPDDSPSGTAAGPATAAATVLVHVVGQVRHPGVVTLPAGARVQQALKAAGGATAKADLVRVNLARSVVDGEQIVVPKPGQPIAGAPAGPTGSGSGAAASPASPVDLNSAGLEQLDALPGVGPVLAQRILDWRSENGRFSSVDDLGEVSGIGDKVLEKLRPLVRV
jgi:competence protein ComEA